MKSKSVKVNTIYSVIKTCSTMLISVVTLPYVSKVLLPDNIGKVHFAEVQVGYFVLLASLGIATHAVRECVAVREKSDKLGEVASQIFSINIISMSISYVALFLVTWLVPKYSPYKMLIFIESFKILFSVVGTDWLNSAMEDFKYITIRTLTIQVLSLLAILIFVKAPSDYYLYAVISVFSATGSNLVNVVYRRRFCKVRFTLNIPWKKHLAPILFLFAMMISQTIMNNTDVTMLGFIKSDYEVGLYSTAYKIIRLVASAVQAVALVIIPRLSIYFAKDDFAKANCFLRKILLFNITLGLPCFIGVEMMAKDIIWLVGGNEYIGAIPIMKALAFSFIFSLVGGSFIGNAILIPMKKEKYYMIACIITALVNVILNALLIPIWSAVGAAIATGITDFVLFLCLYFMMDKRIVIERIKDVFISPIIGCLGIVLCCLLGRFIQNAYIRVGVSVILSVCVYALLLVVLHNEFAVEAIQKIKSSYKLIKTKYKRRGGISND